MSSQQTNDQLVLVCGESGSGKSASLQFLPGDAKVMYLNCESGKRLPFRNKFTNLTITDPYQIFEAFEHAKANPGTFDYIVIDTITFLMDMFESQHVLGSNDTMKGWMNYQQFFKKLMQHYVAQADVSVVILAHTLATLDEQSMTMRTNVPIKGALKNNGVESYFSTVVSTKKVPVKVLKDFPSDRLDITAVDEEMGFKHVFQTRLTTQTVGERIRSPMGMFPHEEPYMDNDCHKLLQHLEGYYA